MTFSISTQIIPSLTKFISDFPIYIKNNFPENFEINIKNGTMQTNTNKAVILPLINDKALKNNLIVIDPNATIDDFEKYNAMMILNQNFLIIKEEGGQINSLSLQGIENITLSRQNLDDFQHKLKPFLSLIIPIFVLLLFLGILIWFSISKLINLAFLTFFWRTCAILMGINFNYSQIFRVGLHAQTIPSFIEFFFFSLGLTFPIPFSYSIILFLFGLYILQQLKESIQTVR